MSNTSSIEWTDATWNPVRGCTKISPGCKLCYAERFAERFRDVPGHPYEQGFDLRLIHTKLADPLRWREPRKIFVNSMSDLFQDGVPFDFAEIVLGIALWSPHTFQILTKRAGRMRQFFSQSSPQRCCDAASDWANDSGNTRLMPKEWIEPSNWEEAERIWIGVSVESQPYADKRIKELVKTPAATRFISYEPALGPIHIARYLRSGLHWVICGGESGPGARTMAKEWARSIRDQCVAADVAFFFKQWGGVHKKEAGRRLDRRIWSEFPQ